MDGIFFKQEIELAEEESGHKNTVIFGDFNMNPFDKGMISAAALNSLPSLRIAKNESRIIQGPKHSFFYNPSWNLLGDLDDTPGTILTVHLLLFHTTGIRLIRS